MFDTFRSQSNVRNNKLESQIMKAMFQKTKKGGLFEKIKVDI